MFIANLSICKKTVRCSIAVALTVVLAGCGPRPTAQGITDPMEAQNRDVHAFNKAVDRAVLKPLSSGDSAGHHPVRDGLANLSTHLSAPGEVVNALLQGRPGVAVENTLRFAINTFVGLGGVLDPATEMGLIGKRTDFGETLYVWGAPEGNYVEVPFLGPSTERDLVGKIVDAGLNPWRFALPRRELNAVSGVTLAGAAAKRGRYSETVDSILYESADSYAQSRLIYLQNRRFELGQTDGAVAADAGFVDPYEDPYGN